ncbi:site-specific integrase [Helicobacter pylori]|uniref:site-specific integrase n=1 Tax=Helicobacter pylori TaxID=210 RepID=UPI0013F4B8E5|nr:site-specific integrase [Helicobacter pylori]NHB41034.1 site-specific integrase [Helicobacter pylori]NHB49940.1 site-specific integrase [Helicobacter pylori]NHB51440.1 site-specific integrase [Helicobacter pylori]
MHNHTIYLRGNALYLNYTKNSKRHRTSLNKLTKNLNLENDKALEYLNGLSLEKILKMQKGALKPNKEPKQESQRTAKKTKRTTIAQAKESFFNQKIGLKAESLRFMHLRFNTILKLMNIKESSKVSKITKESVTNYHNNAFKKYKKNTLISLNALLKSFLEFCEQEGYTEKTPYFKITMKNAKEGGKINPFSLNEIKAILQSAPDLRLKAFLTTAFFTGLRTGEQLALLWSDIDFKNKKINIDKSLNLSGAITSPKNKPSIREVDLLEPVEKILKELKASEPANKKMIFLSVPKRTQDFQLMFKKLLEALNLKDRKLYTTRHTFASLMLSQGEEAMWVSKTLGHKDLNTTYKTYSHYIPQQEKERAKFLKGIL